FGAAGNGQWRFWQWRSSRRLASLWRTRRAIDAWWRAAAEHGRAANGPGRNAWKRKYAARVDAAVRQPQRAAFDAAGPRGWRRRRSAEFRRWRWRQSCAAEFRRWRRWI